MNIEHMDRPTLEAHVAHCEKQRAFCKRVILASDHPLPSTLTEKAAFRFTVTLNTWKERFNQDTRYLAELQQALKRRT